jgi:hypothetical protein
VRFCLSGSHTWRVKLAGSLGVGIALGLMGLAHWGSCLQGPAGYNASGKGAKNRSDASRNPLFQSWPAAGKFHAVPLARSVALPALRGSFSELPLRFELNEGQTDDRVKFLSRGRGYSIFLTSNEAVLALRSPQSHWPAGYGRRTIGQDGDLALLARHVSLPSQLPGPESLPPSILRMKLVGANEEAKVTGLHKLTGTSSYFIGNNPRKWRAKVANYAQVRYEHIYPGIDLVYYGNQQQLEYDFEIAPGADPRAIALEFETGNSKIDSRKSPFQNPRPIIDANGDLVISTEAGVVRFHRPVVYQTPVGALSLRSAQGRLSMSKTPVRTPVPERQSLHASYVVTADHRISFAIPNYDPSKPLVIDPVLSYATYLGGSLDDAGNGIAVDPDGNVYVVGSTGSSDFPLPGGSKSTPGGGEDVFVAKLNSTGTTLLYSAYLGGNVDDHGAGIALDGSRNIYVTGDTASTNFPVTSGAFQTTYGGGIADAFVAAIKADASGLLYASYLGGGEADYGYGIAVESTGSAYVTGMTQSAKFPTANPLQGAIAGLGSSDAFLSKLKPDGSALVFSTYLGGSDADSGHAVALDSSGNAYLTGTTLSVNFPTTQGALQPASGGASDAFVAKVDSAGARLIFSTYLGGSSFDRGVAIGVDSTGNAYVTGDTASLDFPATSGAFQTACKVDTMGNCLGDAFVAKISPDGAGLAYSTYLGGVGIDRGNGLAIDSAGHAYVAGYTGSDDFPILNAIQSAFGGGPCGSSTCPDGFVTELDPGGTALVYSTYLGGNAGDESRAIALDSSGNAVVTGQTSSPTFPVTMGVVQTAGKALDVFGDAFIAKIDGSNAAQASLFPQNLTFADQATGTKSAALAVTLMNTGTGTLDISSIATTGDFAETNTCGPSLAGGGASCVISVTFSPATTGDLTGTLVITDNAAASPQTITLAGKGVVPAPAVTFTPNSLTFADETVGVESAPQTVAVTNTGSAPLTISKVTAAGDFAQTNDCEGKSFAPGTGCTVSVTFKPTASGSRNSSFSITDNTDLKTHSVNLNGNGLAVFSLKSDPASATVSKSTDSTTFKLSVAAPSSFTDSVTLTCPGTISPAACAFNPASIKPGETSTLTVSGLSGVSGSSLSLAITGTSGTQNTTLTLDILLSDFTLTASPPIVTIEAGQSTTYTVTVTPVNGFKEAIALTCGDVITTQSPSLPQETTCTISPTSLTPNGTSPITASVQVTTTKRSSVPPPGFPDAPLFRFPPSWLIAAGLVLFGTTFGLVVLNRRRRILLALATVLILVAVWTGCDNYYYFSSITRATDLKGTQPGNYTYQFVGKVSSLVHTTTVQLTVK